MSEIERMIFEYVRLEPILHALDAKAMQIANARARRPQEIDIKAKVLMDYLDKREGDAVHKLALSLCSDILCESNANPG